MKLSGLSFLANTSKNFKLNLVLVLVFKLQLAIHRGTKPPCWRAKFALGQDK